MAAYISAGVFRKKDTVTRLQQGVYKFKIRLFCGHMFSSPTHQRHSRMAADLSVAPRMFHHDDGTFPIRRLFANSLQYVATALEATS